MSIFDINVYSNNDINNIKLSIVKTKQNKCMALSKLDKRFKNVYFVMQYMNNNIENAILILKNITTESLLQYIYNIINKDINFNLNLLYLNDLTINYITDNIKIIDRLGFKYKLPTNINDYDDFKFEINLFNKNFNYNEKEFSKILLIVCKIKNISEIDKKISNRIKYLCNLNLQIDIVDKILDIININNITNENSIINFFNKDYCIQNNINKNLIKYLLIINERFKIDNINSHLCLYFDQINNFIKFSLIDNLLIIKQKQKQKQKINCEKFNINFILCFKKKTNGKDIPLLVIKKIYYELFKFTIKKKIRNQDIINNIWRVGKKNDYKPLILSKYNEKLNINTNRLKIILNTICKSYIFYNNLFCETSEINIVKQKLFYTINNCIGILNTFTKFDLIHNLCIKNRLNIELINNYLNILINNNQLFIVDYKLYNQITIKKYFFNISEIYNWIKYKTEWTNVLILFEKKTDFFPFQKNSNKF